MNVNVYEQLSRIVIFTIIGIIIGILFDLFRIIRKTFKTPDFFTYIEDIIFWILTGCILLFSIFTFNNGEIRVYVFIGLIFGFLIYLLTISKYFIKMSVRILQVLKKIIYVPVSIICTFTNNYIIKPLLILYRKIKLNSTKLIKKLVKKPANINSPNIYHENNK